MKQEISCQEEALQQILNGQVQTSPLNFRNAPKSTCFEESEIKPLLSATWEKQEVTFAMEFYRQSTPRRFKDATLRAKSSQLADGILPLLVFPWLKPDQLSWLDETGLSGLDLCGNMAITVPERMKIFRCGNSNSFSGSSPIRNIYRGRTSLIARLFTVEESFRMVQEIRDAVVRLDGWARSGKSTEIGLSTVSKSLKTLEEDLIISRDGDSRAIRVVQKNQLLDRLVLEERQQKRPSNQISLKLSKGDLKTTSYLTSALKERDELYVASGLTSANQYTTMQRGPVIQIYSPDIKNLAARLDGEQTDRFPDVVLMESKRESDYFDIRFKNDFPWSSPLQCYLELMKGDKRDIETAAQVREMLLRKGSNCE